MRILFATPYPPSRIRVRGYELLGQLRRHHEVTVVTQVGSERELADVEVLRKRGDEVVIVQESKLRAVLRSGMALPTMNPLQVAYARSARFSLAAQQLLAERDFDVVHVEHLRGIASMEAIAARKPFVWDAVDCISLLSKQTMKAGPSFKVRAVAHLEHARTRRYEARLVEKLPHVLVTSERDRQALIELRRVYASDLRSSDDELGAHISVLPNGVDLRYFSYMQQERKPGNIVFSGKMSYHANIATALYLYRQVMPLIWQHRPDATLTIAGSNPPGTIQALATDARVEVTGYVDDLRVYVGRAEAMLSPMVYSVGIQNKVLEAMALGTPVVVAAQAAAALNARDGHDLLMAESPQGCADAALLLMGDANLRASIGQQGRAYVEQHHDWERVTDRLIEQYQYAIDAHGSRGETRSAPTTHAMADPVTPGSRG